MGEKRFLDIMMAILWFLFEMPHHLFMRLWVYPVELPALWLKGRVQMFWISWRMERRARWRTQKGSKRPNAPPSNDPPTFALSS